MASQRDIRRRIASVQNTSKITKAMEMVAAARLRRAQLRIEALRPYALNMLEFIGQLARHLQVDLSASPLLEDALASQEGGHHRPDRGPRAVRGVQLEHHQACAGVGGHLHRAGRGERPGDHGPQGRWHGALSQVPDRQGVPGCHRAHRVPGGAGSHQRGHPAVRERRHRPGASGLQPFQEPGGAVRHRPGDPAHPRRDHGSLYAR